MRTELFWLLSFCGFAAMTLACGLLAWPQLSAVWPSIQEQIDRFHRLHPLAKVALLLFVGAFVVIGGGKNESTNNGEAASSPLAMNGRFRFFTSGEDAASPLAVTDADIARGWQLWEVRTNRNVTYAMPENATLATNWWVRGAYEDVKPFDFGSWRFPFGTNEHSSLWAFTWARVRFSLNDTNEIAAVGVPMSAVPYRSRLWSAADTNGSRFVTWENFALNRDTNTPVNAQVELAVNGDFVTRSNEVEKVYRRVDPDDWDGDGWRNDDDPDPYVWEEYWDSFWQELPGGANENAYCWIEIRPRWNSYIEFVGDGPSDLDDPYLWAKAGETYRVQLLIGKTYFIESTQPLDVVGLSSPSIEIDGNGTCELEVVWPVRMSALESNGNGFRMVVRPSGLGGFFNWTDSCCTVYGSDLVFRYGCSGNCGCSGCTARGFYEYAGYRLEATGGSCGCSSDDDHPGEDTDDPPSVGVSVSFSERAIIFEDSYANTTNDIVPWNSTATELTCTINGGPNGGYVQIDISGDDNLIQYTGYSLPYSRTLAPNERIEFTNRYKATVESSSEDDIEVTATFVENETGWVDESEAKATAVRVEFKPEVNAPENFEDYRHIVGVCEWIECRQYPSSPLVSFVPLRGGNMVTASYFECPSTACDSPLKAQCGAVQYVPAIQVLAPVEVEARDVDCVVQGVSVGDAGGIALTMDLYAKPFSVSFGRTAMEEVPNEGGGPDGYFENMHFSGEWHHNEDCGAGIWGNVDSNNMMLNDKAGFTNSLPRMTESGNISTNLACRWRDGTITWMVPCGWNVRDTTGHAQPVGQFAIGETQVMMISEQGSSGVRKHRQTVRRDINGDVFLNGRKVR